MKIYEVADKVEKMKNKLYDKEQALETARSITKDIKYANTHMEHGSSFHVAPPYYRRNDWGVSPLAA